MSGRIPEISGYTIKQLIASGGTAEVYLARQESLDRDVALKVLSNEHHDENFTERFLKEGKLIASLQHPNIIAIYDVGVDNGRHYIAMELVEGGDLDHQIQGEPFNEVRALTVLRDVAACLQFVHERGVIHRDVKPANVLFRKNGSLVLTDFGIAKMMEGDVKLTQTGSAVGSPAYSSPEQSQGQALDVRTDIYSLGVMFLEMLLGTNPYKAETYANTSMNHIQMPIPKLEGRLKAYQGLINKMLAKNPADRFPSMEAILDYLANPPKGNWSLPELDEMPRPRTATAWVALLSSALLIAIVSTVVWVKYQDHKAIVSLLVKAELAREEERLLTPEDDSALLYYRQILEIDPANVGAKQGIAHLADHYLVLAQDADKRRDRKAAMLYVTRGLSVDPYHIPLINMKAELEQKMLGRSSSRTAQTQSASQPKPEKQGNFFQRLFD